MSGTVHAPLIGVADVFVRSVIERTCARSQLNLTRSILRTAGSILRLWRGLYISKQTHFGVVSFTALENRIMRQERTRPTDPVRANFILYQSATSSCSYSCRKVTEILMRWESDHRRDRVLCQLIW